MPHVLSIPFKFFYRYNNFHTAAKYYGKNILRRRPVRILNLPKDSITPSNEGSNIKIPSTFVETSISISKTEGTQVMLPPYEKLQKNDAKFTKVLTSMKSRKWREKKGQILLEGKRLINDAITAGMELKTIYFSREKDLADIKFRDIERVDILKVFYKSLAVWSDLKTCPGVMGVFKKPTQETLEVISHPVIPVTVLCDNIREPGNLGSIIRNAAASGCKNILLMKGCVDPWETKVLRSACGGHFRIPIIDKIEWPQISNYLPKQCTVYVADNSSDIECSELSSEYISFDEADDREEPKKYIGLDEKNSPVAIDETYDEPEKFEDVSLPCQLYSSLKYPRENIVLYVGGETHGIDPRVVKLACEYGGRKVKIPLENDMDSLNSSFALTILLYEIKRQLYEKYVTQ